MLSYLWSSRGFLQAVVVFGLFLLSLFKGAAPERWCSGILLGAIVLARTEQAILSRFETVWGLSGFIQSHFAYLAIDFLTFAGLAVVALRANRIYPLWMAGVQLTALLTHLADRVSQSVPSLAYAALNLSTFYLAIGFLAAGLIAHIRRQKQWGRYPSWRRDLPLTPDRTRQQ